ncbi:hypothetical protein FQZ97_900780 [compost metagenome]
MLLGNGRVRHQVALAHADAAPEQAGIGRAAFEHRGSKHELEGAAQRKALVRAVLQACAAAGVKARHAKPAAAGTFEFGELRLGTGLRALLRPGTAGACQRGHGDGEQQGAALDEGVHWLVSFVRE